MAISKRKRRKNKPDKPSPDFPLYAHASKRWAKKIRGCTHYFGPWSDPDGALNNYLDQKDDLMAGRVPRVKRQEGLALQELCDRFLTSKRRLLDASELSPRTFLDYYDVSKVLIRQLHSDRLVTDLRPDDFEKLRAELPATWGPARRSKAIQIIRSIFKYANDEDLIDRSVKLGKSFKRPSKKVMRLHRAKNGKSMFTADELRRLVGAAGQPLKTMILLAINTGFGNNDISSLPISALDLDRAMVNFPRPKTGVERRCPLWPEVVAGLREVIDRRPQAKDDKNAGLVFVTKYGHRWVKVDFETHDDKVKVSTDDAISKEMAKLLGTVGLKRPKLGFYTLRRTFRTIADQVKDQPAANLIMGHEGDEMAATYRQEIGDDRLRAVTDHVHKWLFDSIEIKSTGTAD